MSPEPHPPLMKRIAAQRDALSRSHRAVADYVLANPFQAATLGIEDLATACGVSVATINRFAREFGFSGFVAFRTECLQIYARTLEPVEKVRRLEGGEARALPLMQASLAAARDDIDRALAGLDAEVCTRIVEMLLAARRVFVIGLGVSSTLARLTQQLFEQSLPVIELLDGTGGTERIVRRLAQIGDGDLVLGISLQRYSQFTVEVLRRAREAGARIACITDFADSPLVPLAEAALLSPSDHPVLHGSLASVAATIEAVSTVLVRRCATESSVRKLTEDLLPYLYTSAD